MTVYEGEIDLRPYILLIARRWWVIVSLSAVFIALAAAYTLLQPRQYEATATLVLTRNRLALTLAEQFPTINEPIDSRSRMDAIRSIASSEAIANTTRESLTSMYPDEINRLVSLSEIVSIENRGDAILIKTTADNPEFAASLANTWSEEAVRSINLAYSGEQPLEEIQEKLTAASQEYQSAQQQLERFISENQIALLRKRVGEAETMLESLTGERARRVEFLDKRKITLEQIILEAESLRLQLEEGSVSLAGDLGDALAILRARAEILHPVDESASMNDLIINLQISDLAEMQGSQNDYVEDLNTIIQQARNELDRINNNISALTQEVVQDQSNSLIDMTAQKLQEYETELEIETAQELALTSQRDLAWEAYQALAQKEVEIRNAAQTDNVITVANQAVPPAEPLSRGLVITVVVAGVLGALLSTFIVFAMNWWQSSNNSEEETISQVSPN